MGVKDIYSAKVFSAWDFSIESRSAATLKSRSIYNELKVPPFSLTLLWIFGAETELGNIAIQTYDSNISEMLLFVFLFCDTIYETNLGSSVNSVLACRDQGCGGYCCRRTLAILGR